MIGGFGKCSHVTQEKDNTYLGEANLFQLGVILSVASALLFASPPLKCCHVTQEKDDTYLGKAHLFQLGVFLSVASALLFAPPPLRSADAESKDRYTKWALYQGSTSVVP